MATGERFGKALGMNPKAELAALRKHFASIGTKKRAEGEKAYLKSDLDFFGATVPQVRRAAKDFKKAHPALDRASLVTLVEALWKTRYHELRSVGIALLEIYADELRATDIQLVEDLIRKSKTWALVDWLACKVAGSLVSRFPKAKSRLRRWAKDEDFWVRRSAMLALLTELRAGDGDFELFAKFATSMIEEREFFIRKAIGWVLRDTGRTRPELVFGFLEAHIDTVSGLTLREGSKYLSTRHRETLMRRFKSRSSR